MLGVGRHYEAAVSDLPPGIRVAVERLLSNPSHYKNVKGLSEKARDFILYTISIENDDTIQHFTFNDLSMPPEMEALIRHCTQHAKVK